MKIIAIAGGLTRDAVTRSTQNGDKVTGFSVAVSDGFGDTKRTIYFDCSLWGKRGESLAQYLTKGGKVAVSGELSTREHEGKTYLTVKADQVTLLGGRNDSGGRDDSRGGYDDRGGQQHGHATPLSRTDIDDDLPF